MTIAELLTKYNITPSPTYTGDVDGRDFILAVDCSEDGSGEVTTYAPVAVHVENAGAELSPENSETNFLYEGASTLKKSTKRAFKVEGKRIIGDAFQDFCMSHAIKFGRGAAVQRGYVYFCALTGVGESGTVSICVNKDGGAGSGAAGEIDIELTAIGTPDEYTYTVGA